MGYLLAEILIKVDSNVKLRTITNYFFKLSPSRSVSLVKRTERERKRIAAGETIAIITVAANNRC